MGEIQAHENGPKQKIPLRLAQGDLLKVFKFSLTSKE
jgi:hypothetical protein